MFKGKGMAECFAVMYVNPDKSIECAREENLDTNTNIAGIDASLQGTTGNTSDIHEIINPEIIDSVSSEKGDSN